MIFYRWLLVKKQIRTRENASRLGMIEGVSMARAGRKNVSRRDSKSSDKRAQPGMAVPRREVLGSIVEFSQAEL
jgi:hypothetical protein